MTGEDTTALLRARYGTAPDFEPPEIPPGLAAILDRRVTRRYRPEPVPEPLLLTLLAAAQSAPSKSDLQQYSIVVVQEPAKIAAVADWIGTMPWIREAPVFLFFCGDIRRGRRLCELRGLGHANDNVDTFLNATADAALAMAHLILAAEMAGLGSCPVSYVRNHLERVAPLLGLPRGVFPVAGLTLGVTLLDQARAGTVGAMVDQGTADIAVAQSQRLGYLDGKALAGVFAWLRPNDLIWNYWVNNYLLGKRPPAFDVLYWNSDTTRMPAGLHRDFIRVSLDNSLTKPGALTALGTPIDLSQIDVDSYVVAGSTDHICPWDSCYRSVHLLGGRTRFVLSTAGHIAALVNPPTNPTSNFRVNEALPASAEEWQAGAVTHPGSWWSDHAAWLGERSGELVDAPSSLGSEAHPVLGPAPGTYVRES